MNYKICGILNRMTKEEKEILFNLLKKASGQINGYTTENFASCPVFEDDKSEDTTFGRAAENQTGNAATPVPETVFHTSETVHSPENVQAAPEMSPEAFAKLKLTEISEKIQRCSNCVLSSTRKNAVPGEGVFTPHVLVIGEAPGEDEDLSGRPFVGKAGELLDKMLAAIGLSRNANCFIANTVKCRPPKNRDPQSEEMSACRSFLDAQITILKPKYILLLGKVSVRDIFGLKDEFSLSQYRQKLFEYHKIPVVVTYHPSALLRNPEYKKPAWEDLKFLGTELRKNYPEYTKK